MGLRAYFFPLWQHYDPQLANVTDDEWRQIAAAHEIGSTPPPMRRSRRSSR